MTNEERTFIKINMKKIILLFVLFIIAGCGSNNNKGYGYDAKQETKSKSLFELAEEKRLSHTMYLYGSDGRKYSDCTVYKGEFDGHTWYVFYGNLASPSVVHDPNCKCFEKQ